MGRLYSRAELAATELDAVEVVCGGAADTEPRL